MERAERLPFFVYGTLRPGEENYRWALAGRVAAERPAVLPGAALHDGPGYPFAVEDPEAAVRGELITVRDEYYAEVLAVLDRLEEVQEGGGGVYERLRRPVVLADGSTVPAWVYLAGPEISARLRRSPVLIASGDWTRRRAGAEPGPR